MAGILVSLGLCYVSAQAGTTQCGASPGFGYVCGQEHPEDLVRIPGTRWLIASGFSDGAGLKLVDTTARSIREPVYRAGTASDPATAPRTNCGGPPERRRLNIQGLSLRPTGAGRSTLYAVNHGGRESVEVFEVDAAQDTPELTWKWCVDLPSGLAANSVASYSDGTILITVLARPGFTYADFVEGKNTGGVYRWRPGDSDFELLPGTELPGNNGIETAADDSGFFVVAFGRHAVLSYSRREPDSPPVESVAPGFMPDNIHWDSGHLIAAGMVFDEPACGGVRKVVDGKADPMKCHRGTVVAELNPVSMKWRTVAYFQPDPVFNGASSARLVGDVLWIGSYQSNCIVYRALPWLE